NLQGRSFLTLIAVLSLLICGYSPRHTHAPSDDHGALRRLWRAEVGAVGGHRDAQQGPRPRLHLAPGRPRSGEGRSELLHPGERERGRAARVPPAVTFGDRRRGT